MEQSRHPAERNEELQEIINVHLQFFFSFIPYQSLQKDLNEAKSQYAQSVQNNVQLQTTLSELRETVLRLEAERDRDRDRERDSLRSPVSSPSVASPAPPQGQTQQYTMESDASTFLWNFFSQYFPVCSFSAIYPPH